MSKYDSIFKTYDIRSLDHDPMDETFCYSFGRGVAGYCKENGWESIPVLVSRDGRTNHGSFMVAFIAGLQDGGHTLFEVPNRLAQSIEGQKNPYGVCCTSFFYYCAIDTFEVSVHFTASHNPNGRVGCKGCNKDAMLYQSAEFKAMIKEYIEYPYLGTQRHEDIKQQIIEKVHSGPDRLKQKEQSYYTLLLDAFKKLSKPVNVVVDYSGGGGVSWERHFLNTLVEDEEVPVTITEINELIDKTFSCHLSDTSIPENYQQVGNTVVEQSTDLGVMFDGDADRIGLVDERGEYVQGGNVVALIARGVLAVKPGGTIVSDVTSTNAIREGVEALGGKNAFSRVGYRFVKAVMRENNAIFGGELSCHFLFPETSYSETPLLALAYLLKTLEEYATVSEAVAAINPYVTPPLTNRTVTDKDGVLNHIRETYLQYDINETDGVRVNGDNRRFLVRKSGTEPIIRYYLEAETTEKIDSLRQEVEAIVDMFIE